MNTPRTSVARALGAVVGVLALSGAGAAVATTLTSGSPNPAPPTIPGAVASVGSLSAVMPAGSELKFVPVAPCRVLDTRVVGGALLDAARNFAAFGGYAGQGGNAAGCGIPTYAKALAINVGAISQNLTDGFVKGYAYGTAAPNASIVNFDKSGPTANLVTLPISAGSPSFTLFVHHKAHLFADVMGYYAAQPYVAIASNGSVYSSVASGVVSTARTGTGMYTITFDRDVTRCAATTNSITWASNHDPSADVNAGAGNQVVVGVADGAGALVDSYFTLALSC